MAPFSRGDINKRFRATFATAGKRHKHFDNFTLFTIQTAVIDAVDLERGFFIFGSAWLYTVLQEI